MVVVVVNGPWWEVGREVQYIINLCLGIQEPKNVSLSPWGFGKT